MASMSARNDSTGRKPVELYDDRPFHDKHAFMYGMVLVHGAPDPRAARGLVVAAQMVYES